MLLKRSGTVRLRSSGVEVTMPDAWPGWVYLAPKNTRDETRAINFLPVRGISSLANRSRITGSFKHKGDPRWQPRDLATFVHLDGTSEIITLENITLSHEKGGLQAEVTYRKGIV